MESATALMERDSEVLSSPTDSGRAHDLIRRYDATRAWSESICEPLTDEDYVIQSMTDCSPAKWHLAHTSWFFETFLLKPNVLGYVSPHPQYEFLFNSYYNSIGERHCRAKRGLISRPTVTDTYKYRHHVDQAMRELLDNSSVEKLDSLIPLVELGINHEQQHQELMVTDLKHMFSENPLLPAYRSIARTPSVAPPALTWLTFDGGVCEIGYSGSEFSFDNETPQHREYVAPFAIGSRLVTNREYLDFMNDGGYRRPEFWLSEGWATAQARGWESPLYWERDANGQWQVFTLHGVESVNLEEPVCHVSLFEADAYAHWADSRLPTEPEWEVAAQGQPIRGNLAESGQFHPVAADGQEPLTQMIGDVWEWTRSQYSPYPGYQQAKGALGEYNGKFMCNQFVLRGGSCATPESHMRISYRNFFPPDARWQFMGIRLAKDI